LVYKESLVQDTNVQSDRCSRIVPFIVVEKYHGAGLSLSVTLPASSAAILYFILKCIIPGDAREHRQSVMIKFLSDRHEVSHL
jgi:hypothetical protein